MEYKLTRDTLTISQLPAGHTCKMLEFLSQAQRAQYIRAIEIRNCEFDLDDPRIIEIFLEMSNLHSLEIIGEFGILPIHLFKNLSYVSLSAQSGTQILTMVTNIRADNILDLSLYIEKFSETDFYTICKHIASYYTNLVSFSFQFTQLGTDLLLRGLKLLFSNCKKLSFLQFHASIQPASLAQITFAARHAENLVEFRIYNLEYKVSLSDKDSESYKDACVNVALHPRISRSNISQLFSKISECFYDPLKEQIEKKREIFDETMCEIFSPEGEGKVCLNDALLFLLKSILLSPLHKKRQFFCNYIKKYSLKLEQIDNIIRKNTIDILGPESLNQMQAGMVLLYHYFNGDYVIFLNLNFEQINRTIEGIAILPNDLVPVKLDFNNCQISNFILPNPIVISDLAAVKEIYLMNCEVGPGSQAIGQFLTQIPNLRKLIIENSSSSQGVVEIITQIYSECLSNLSIAGNNLSHEQIVKLCRHIGKNMPNTTCLDINGNNLSSQSLNCAISELSGCKFLTILYAKAAIVDFQFSAYCQTLGNFKHLLAAELVDNDALMHFLTPHSDDIRVQAHCEKIVTEAIKALRQHISLGLIDIDNEIYLRFAQPEQDKETEDLNYNKWYKFLRILVDAYHNKQPISSYDEKLLWLKTLYISECEEGVDPYDIISPAYNASRSRVEEVINYAINTIENKAPDYTELSLSGQTNELSSDSVETTIADSSEY